jgi:hypothetical protein
MSQKGSSTLGLRVVPAGPSEQLAAVSESKLGLGQDAALNR